MKARIFFLSMFCSALAAAQVHNITHKLRFAANENAFYGTTTIVFPAGLYQDSLLLHLPSRALSWKESQLNKQVADFQRVDLYYAKKNESGFIDLDSTRINAQTFSACAACEFLSLALPETTADSLVLFLRYKLMLPQARFIGIGVSEKSLRLVDWLPRIPAKDSSGWQAVPINFYGSTFYEKDHFRLQLQMPQHVEMVSNLGPGVYKSDGHNQRTWYFSGTARQLQVFGLVNFVKAQLAGKLVYMEHENILLRQHFARAQQRISSFFKSELNDSLNRFHSVIFLEEKEAEFQSEGLLSLELPNDTFKLNQDLVQARGEAFFRYQLGINAYAKPWLGSGLPYYYKYRYIKKNFPSKRWVPYASGLLGKLLDLDEFDYAYQNQFLYLFLARQGLDQALTTPTDSLSRLNYEGMAQAKTFLAFDHLRAYTGERNFKRSMARFAAAKRPTPQKLQNSFNYYAVKPVNWFFDSYLPSNEIYDYRLKQIDHCPTVTTATVQNLGAQNIPYSLTGFKDGQEVITEWFAGHQGQKNVQLYHEDFDKVVLNAHSAAAEYNQKNNTYYPRWLLQRAEPLSLAFYNSFEAPDRSQVFYMPTLAYNAYDKVLAGMIFTNASFLVDKPWEYLLNPTFSTGTSQLTGSASLIRNYTTPKSHFFRQVRAGLYTRYFHYDQDLSFFRMSPAVNLYIRKPYPKSPLIQSIRLRGVRVARQLPAQANIEERLNLASYTVFNAGYKLEKTNIFNPTIFRFDVEISDRFSKIYSEYDQRWMLPNKKWLILRLFAGAFVSNSFSAQGFDDNFYSFGLGGTQDYLFDYNFIGRSDESGIWSQQFFITDGGFKAPTRILADGVMTTANLSVPIYSVVGVFGDAGLADGNFYWDYGVRLSLLTDFAEIYLPLQNQSQRFYQQENYLQNVRFILDLDLGNILNRLRRGFY